MNQNKMPRTPFSTPLSGSARETELRIQNIVSGPKKRPPALFLALMFSVCLLCGNLVSCHVAEQEGGSAPQNPDTSSSLEAGISVLPQEVDRAVLENADLDGDGLPDQLTVVTQQFEEQDGEYTLYTNPVIVQAVLGSGQVLEHRWETENMLRVDTLTAGRLTGEDHEDILLTFEIGYSNYDAASVHIVRIADGELTAEEFGGDKATLRGACLVSQEDSPLAAVRIPVSTDKWEPPAWYTLHWNGTDLVLSLDAGAETYSAKVSDVQTLTLVPQGETVKNDYFRCYEQIQVWADSVLLQTITEEDIPQEDNYLFEGILRGYNTLTGEQLDVRDVNFDGCEDFGVYCGASYNGPMYWFLWDEENERFRPGFHSSIDLRVDEENKQLVDVWRDGNIAHECYTYQFNDQGKRELVNYQRTTDPDWFS